MSFDLRLNYAIRSSGIENKFSNCKAVGEVMQMTQKEFHYFSDTQN